MTGALGRIPRSALVLAGALVVAVAAMVLLGDRGGDDATLGGRIFDRDPRDIDGLLVTRQGSQFRLDRSADGVWSLGGDISDYVQQNAVFELIRSIVLAQGGPLLPGTEPEDRRYDFNGPDALRLTVFAGDQEPLTLALGAANPVSSLFYASGAGRPGCFQVPAEFRQKLWRLPWDVVSRTLLPTVDRQAVTGLELPRAGGGYEARFVEGRWWLEVPEQGPAVFGPVVAAYQALYDDRRMEMDGRTWILAAEDKVASLIYQVSDPIVRRILPAAEGDPLKGPWQLDPPWRSVILKGAGINPDPTAADPDRLEIGFGPYLGDEGVPVLRRGNVLLADREAIMTLEQPISVLAHDRALAENPLEADELELNREGRLLLKGERSGQAATGEGREAWVTVEPAEPPENTTRNMYHGFTRDLVVNLWRLPILTVLPAGTPASLIEDREKVTIVLTRGTGEGARRAGYEIGFADPAATPAGVRWVPDPETARPAVFRELATGRMFQVPGHVIVTARSLVGLMGDP